MTCGRRGRGEVGVAHHAALLLTSIVVLAAVGLAVVAASTAAISADDAASARAADVAESGVADALERIRWGWASLESLPATFDASGVGLDGKGSYSARVAVVAPGSAACPRLQPGSPVDAADPGVRAVRVDVTGRWGPARRTVHSFALSTPDALPRGLVVHGDVVLQSSTALQDCGLYAGGDVSGREHVVLTSPPDTPPATEGVSDLAWGGLYLEAGVHARGTIWQSGAEEHQAGDAPAVDSDTHTGVLPPAGLVAEPSPALLAALITHSSDPRAARGADGVDLALLDQSAPPLVGDPQLPAAGRIYVVSDDQATAVVLFGARPSVPQACPMTLVVLGDCTTSAGAAGESPPRFAGALVVTGTLLVEAPLLVDGGVYAARLVVHAPLAVVREPTTARDVAPGASYIHSGSCTQ